MNSRKKATVLMVLLVCLVPANAAQAKNGFNDMGRGIGHALGGFARGTGHFVDNSGHVIVHGSGRIIKTSADGTGKVVGGTARGIGHLAHHD